MKPFPYKIKNCLYMNETFEYYGPFGSINLHGDYFKIPAHS